MILCSSLGSREAIIALTGFTLTGRHSVEGFLIFETTTWYVCYFLNWGSVVLYLVLCAYGNESGLSTCEPFGLWSLVPGHPAKTHVG